MINTVNILPEILLQKDEEDQSLLRLYSQGKILSDSEKYEEAIVFYNKVLKVNPEQETVWFDRGVALHYLNKHEEAIISYCKALEVNPDYEDAWFNRQVDLKVKSI